MKRLPHVLRQLALPALAATLLAGCGGGIYVDVSDPWGPPPDISLTASTPVARRGDLVRLSAAITVPDGTIDRITFYRIEPGVSTALGTLYGPPAQLDTPIPFNAGNSVGYWAKVCDLAGYCSESATVYVSVSP